MLEESVEMQTYDNQTAGYIKEAYKPPVFKKDFFDSLIRSENKEEEPEIEEKKVEAAPTTLNYIKDKVLSLYKEKKDLTAFQVK